MVNDVGCDSILTVNLTVLSNVSNTVDSIICQSELPFTWNDVTFTSSGTQFAQLEADNGVDSIVVMNVTVLPTNYYRDTLTACDSLTWIDGVTYYESTDTNIYVLTAANGCDSVVT